MHVAYVCADAGVPVFGSKGCSIHVQEIVRAFLRRGDSVEIFAARLGGRPPADLSNCIVHEFPLAKHLTTANRESAQHSLARTIAQHIVFSQFDLIYERYSLWSDDTQKHAADFGVHSVLEVNAPLIDEQQLHRELHNRSGAEQCAVNAFRHAGRIVAVSAEVAEYVRTFFPDQTGRHLTTVQVVNNGVDVDRFRPSGHVHDRSGKQSHSCLTIGFVGSLKPWHGVESLIEAFQMMADVFPDTQLKIIGDGPMRDTLESSLLDSSIAHRIHFHGAVPAEEMPTHLTSLDIAVAPYLKNDGFYFSPLKVYEYMACGLPVAASATGQLNELIQNGENGLLYEAGNVSELRQALTRLAEDRQLRKLLGAAARATVVHHHSWQQTLERILEPAVCETT
ncbi:MAG: glycosyltransferase family 4 protein [Planctomyces sp.]|nr:glycosyltransferase family 4 protein [Planctomyces sp.]